MAFRDFLKCLIVVALIAIAAILLSITPCCAQCPPGVICPQQQPQVIVAPAPTPVFRAPIRRALYEFMTPQGAVVQGYLVRPLQPLTREQALRNAAYWQRQAERLAAPPAAAQSL